MDTRSNQFKAISDFLLQHYGANTKILEITPLKGGIASPIFKIDIQLNPEKKLCVVIRKNPKQKPFTDFNREILFQDYCANSKIGPKIFHRDDDYTLMEFILGEWPMPMALDKTKIVNIAKSLHVLHSANLQLNKPQAHFLFRIKEMFRNTNIEPEKEKILVQARDWLDKMESFFYKPNHLCSCHLDLNPGNLLLDQNNAFLIDFTDSNCDDRYIDLGIFSAYFGLDITDKKYLLEFYFFPTKVSEKKIALLNIAQMIFELRLGMVGLLNAKSDDQLKKLLSIQEELNPKWKEDHYLLVHDYLYGKIQDQETFYKRLVHVFYLSWKQKINSNEHLKDVQTLSNPSYKNLFTQSLANNDSEYEVKKGQVLKDPYKFK